jgi:hypothetical protein
MEVFGRALLFLKVTIMVRGVGVADSQKKVGLSLAARLR